jgi:putative sigma-54 modulation protein
MLFPSRKDLVMQITITARHCELDEAYKHHAEQEILRLTRYIDQILNAGLIIVQEKYRYTAELNIHIDGATLTSKEEDPEMYVALDKAAAKMERQLKKFNAKLHDHRVRRDLQAP